MIAQPSFLPTDSAWLPVFIFFARITDVSIGTMRLICVTRGRKTLAVVLGFLEVTVWILAISSVFSRLDHWVNIVAYAGGFATGNAVGMWIERMLAMGVQVVLLISRGSAHAVAERLRFAGMIVTTFIGAGRHGPVSLCLAIVPRRKTASVIRMAKDIDPDVIVTVEDVVESSIRSAVVSHPGKFRSRLMPVIGARVPPNDPRF